MADEKKQNDGWAKPRRFADDGYEQRIANTVRVLAGWAKENLPPEQAEEIIDILPDVDGEDN